MSKLILAGAVALLTFSCGGGSHNCDAFRTADYTKYKVKKKMIANFNKLVSFNIK